MPSGVRKRWIAVAQILLVLLAFGFLIAVVVTQWRELQERDVRFEPVWLLPAIPLLVALYALSALAWDLLLRALGHRLEPIRAQAVWSQSLLARYVPGGVVMVVGRVMLAGREGVPARVTLASIVYEVALLVASAALIAAYPLISGDELSGAAELAVLAVVPIVIAALHPRVFGPVSGAILRAFRREPLETLIPLRSTLALLGLFLVVWCVGGAGMFFAGLTVFPLEASDLPVVTAALAVGFSTAAAVFVFPGGLGVRDAVFASLVGSTIPGGFTSGATVAIAARLISALVEVGYAGAASWLARRRSGLPLRRRDQSR